MREISRLVAVLASICLVSALTLAAVHDLTEEPIAHQRRLMMLRSLKAVLPPFDNQPDQDLLKVGAGEEEVVFYQARKGEELVGTALVTISKTGYGGEIEVMTGMDPEGTIRGIKILRHLETPGLGNKIEDPDFTGQFGGRNLDDTRWSVKKDGGDIDQITGATISPRAVVQAVEEALVLFRDHYPEGES